MTTRHVTDILRDINGNLLPGVPVTIGLDKSSYTGAAAYLRTPQTFLTDVNGAYDVVLWCDEEGLIATRYYALYPDGVASVGKPSFTFDLPVGDGSPVLMSSLRTAAPGVPAVSLQTYVDMALAALTYNLDGGTPATAYGGTTLIDGGVV